MMDLAEYRRSTPTSLQLTSLPWAALVAPGVVSATRTAHSSVERIFARSRPRPRRQPNRSAITSRLNNAAPPRNRSGRSSSRRSINAGQALSSKSVPGRRLRAWSTPSGEAQFEERRRPLREPLFPHPPLSAAGRRRRPRRALLYEDRAHAERRWPRGLLQRVRRPQPIVCSHLVEGFMPEGAMAR